MNKIGNACAELAAVMEELLAENGCPWDREQTHISLIRYLLEETYEVIEAVNLQDPQALKSELGDLLLQIVFHSALSSREGDFDLADVADSARQKMIDRHPHVFGSLELKTSKQVMERWEDFKKQAGRQQLLSGIPKELPALLRALKLQEKASRVGFDWPDKAGAAAKFEEEKAEMEVADSPENHLEEWGDMFFALSNWARLANIDPEQALQRSNDKFVRRFNYLEQQVQGSGRTWSDFTLAELNALWEAAKKAGL